MSEARTLVLLRHGQTTYNATHRIQGQVDSPLTDRGHEQAARVAPTLRSFAPVALWSSDLQRAADTAGYVSRALGLEVRLDARLREFSLGEREGITHAEYAERWPEEHDGFMTGIWSSVPGAESVHEVRLRTQACLEELAETLAPGECGIAVAHGAALRVAAEALVTGGESEPTAFSGMDNCCYAVLRERVRRRAGEPRWRLRSYNVGAGEA